ncbi:MAG: pseudaminic acid cytidylyltransferase [Gammaproteobacteria bacterium]|nr:pseudaminic acid cytidylyltransferase [Gammaproteobacteria bacterium]MCF6230408.1 pseudaminic acid cytidylyltransferase [Gammaproteobacteria bacterium]
MNIAVIPARGGSKRIPRKNIKSFCGKPIIAYSIEVAQETGLFDKIVVSTDDEEIATVAQKYGAEIPFIRPKEISDDYTGTNAVVKHAIQWFENSLTQVEYACCLYATAPFVQSEYLKQSYQALNDSNKIFSFSVTSFAFPIQRSIRICSNGGVEAIFPETMLQRSQDLEEAYHDAGQFYWGRAQAFLNDRTMFATHSLPIILPRHLVQDIDTPEDWLRAELMYRAWLEHGEGS